MFTFGEVRKGQDIVQDTFVIHNIGKEKNGDTRIGFDSGGSRGSSFGSIKPPTSRLLDHTPYSQLKWPRPLMHMAVVHACTVHDVSIL